MNGLVLMFIGLAIMTICFVGYVYLFFESDEENPDGYTIEDYEHYRRL